MRKQAVDLWLKGLESGRFPQGKGALLRDSRYCCLGVACAVAMEQGVVMELTVNDMLKKTLFNDQANYLPKVVCDWLEVSEEDRPGSWDICLPFKDRKGNTITLTVLNDLAELTFAQIADVIRYFWGNEDA